MPRTRQCAQDTFCPQLCVRQGCTPGPRPHLGSREEQTTPQGAAAASADQLRSAVPAQRISAGGIQGGVMGRPRVGVRECFLEEGGQTGFRRSRVHWPAVEAGSTDPCTKSTEREDPRGSRRPCAEATPAAHQLGTLTGDIGPLKTLLTQVPGSGYQHHSGF